MKKKYSLSNEQREYILDLLFEKQELVSSKVFTYQQIRKSERGISTRQIKNEEKFLSEFALNHAIVHELTADDFKVSN